MSNQSPDIQLLLKGDKGFVYQNLVQFFQEEDLLRNGKDDKEGSRVTVIHIAGDQVGSCEHKELPDAVIADVFKLVVLSIGGCDPQFESLPYSEEILKDAVALNVPQVFGKWASPGGGNPVADICYGIASNQPEHKWQFPQSEFIYIDDLANKLKTICYEEESDGLEISPLYTADGQEVINLIKSFRDSRTTLIVPDAGTGFVRALYATYLSYLEPNSFKYKIDSHPDSRGQFVEFVKTGNNGQVSILTAGVGVTRGQHYHHTKTEKFLVVKGTASFQFRHLVTDKTHEIITSGDEPEIVETIPGWVHNIKNIGDEELIVVLWANEIFNPELPDTNQAEI